MRIRSAIVAGSFAAASGAFPQLSIPPEAGKGANSNWHLPPRIRPRAGASDGPTAAREPPPAPAPRGAQKSPSNKAFTPRPPSTRAVILPKKSAVGEAARGPKQRPCWLTRGRCRDGGALHEGGGNHGTASAPADAAHEAAAAEEAARHAAAQLELPKSFEHW